MGKLIVIEGGDGAGKETQAKLALQKLKGAKWEVEYFDFPQYEKSVMGPIIRNALSGKYGDFKALDPHLASLPYLLDQLLAKWYIDIALLNGSIALCNRWVPSNAMYQGAKFDTETEQNQFIGWLEELEYGHFNLPMPDLVCYLHVPGEVSRELRKQRGALDQHEADEAYQKKVIELYLRTAKARRDWCVIECVENGELLSREEIHQRVMCQINALL